jgi:hypothetical protein
MGGNNFLEPRLSFQIVGVEVRLDGLAERFLKSLSVIVGARIKQPL